MLSLITLALAAATLVSADSVNLSVSSDNSEVNGNSLGFTHEGAGINYGFLGTSATGQSVNYDASTGVLSVPFADSYVQEFSVDSEYVALTVAGSEKTFSFNSDNELLVEGSSDGFYACKNTNDPYRYSERSYELMYYTSNAPEGCISVKVIGTPSGSSSSAAPGSSSTESTTVSTASETSTSTEPTTTATTSEFTDAAAANAPIAAGAAVFGLIAALL